MARRRVARHRCRDGERRERRTAGHASHVGEARLAGFDKTRGAGDGFGRGHGAWPARRPRRRTDAVMAKNRGGREMEMVVMAVLQLDQSSKFSFVNSIFLYFHGLK